jgi:hypothetical protein
MKSSNRVVGEFSLSKIWILMWLVTEVSKVAVSSKVVGAQVGGGREIRHGSRRNSDEG